MNQYEEKYYQLYDNILLYEPIFGEFIHSISCKLINENNEPIYANSTENKNITEPTPKSLYCVDFGVFPFRRFIGCTTSSLVLV